MTSKYVLGYSAETVSEPILWRLVKDFDIRVNILRAEISPGQEGNLLVEFGVEEEEKLSRALSWLESIGVSWVSVSKRLFWDEDRCIDCGSCSGVCFSGAIVLDRTDWKLQVNRDLCVACGNCVKACPMGCFTLDFGEVS
ncbi:MAG TPA: 4Fe-4S binding protein [Termitinemataceae bacterium]|nr:4Fe-4S binding protein [Termitinemataceae bacterium]HOM22461.1 4Fe-4S binding protein [Termitinemataceae bacterium]HPQ01089.1 4Fe-4S binding protein [Termitinemataceae bacterium]